uniref:RAS p21 protein activator 2 n=1 Tax=Athene cunicularia TaxID=194338 RepID=A0A663N5K7_ATHCN
FIYFVGFSLSIFTVIFLFTDDAKHLVPNKMRDFFCTINLDQEEVFRTQVVEKSLSPYFGEEFYFEIPRTFQWLSFYIYDKSVLQKDLRIGKVSIKKEDLCNYTGKENWFMLQPVDSNSEVQGKVHLELKLNELITDNGSVCQQLVNIMCFGSHNTQCSNTFYVTSLGACLGEGMGMNDQKKTKVKKKTSNPQFNETFYFEVTRSSSYTKKSQFQVEEEDIEKLEVRVDLWNNGNLVQDVFLGEIKVPVKVLRNDSFQAWYLLQPRENGNKSSKNDDLGSLRLNICYTEDCVLPSEYYTSLRNLLLKSSDVQPISASAAYILSEVCRDKYDAVLPLVRLLLHHHKLVPFVAAVAELDLKDTQEANTVFRGNSLATRCVDEMMKIVGKHYLKVTLKPVIDEVGKKHRNANENLRYYVDKVFREIVRSSISCPTLMCDVFYSLRHLAAKRFPNDPHVQYSAVSSFVFLRFFAVAVVSPHTFHLRPHHPDAQTSRTLTLISKAIQTLGSWGSLTKSKLSSFKETFMCEFFKTFQEEKFTESVKKFLDDVSSTESREPSGLSEPVHLKEGEMYKRAQGRTRIGKKNFKKRWFCLTSREFTYHKQQDKEPIFTIPIKNILAVEKLDESSFNKKNMFQVLHGEKPLYIQANNCVEASEWIEALCRVTRCNQKRLSFYHPSAFLNGNWLCCKATIENTVGCARCTADVPADTQIEIDGDRETERIYSLFTINMSKLQKLEEACGSIAVYQGPRKEPDDYSNFTIEDSVATFHTLKQIIDIVEKLNESHEKYQKKRSSSKEKKKKLKPQFGLPCLGFDPRFFRKIEFDLEVSQESI